MDPFEYCDDYCEDCGAAPGQFCKDNCNGAGFTIEAGRRLKELKAERNKTER